jgi:LacI family transcriptional regulator
MGLRVPDDVSVTGFDDLPIAKYLAPPLTTIRQERFTLGKSAFTLLNQLISGHRISTLLYQSELVIRESSGKAKK